MAFQKMLLFCVGDAFSFLLRLDLLFSQARRMILFPTKFFPADERWQSWRPSFPRGPRIHNGQISKNNVDGVIAEATIAACEIRLHIENKRGGE